MQPEQPQFGRAFISISGSTRHERKDGRHPPDAHDIPRPVLGQPCCALHKHRAGNQMQSCRFQWEKVTLQMQKHAYGSTRKVGKPALHCKPRLDHHWEMGAHLGSFHQPEESPSADYLLT